MITEDKFRKYVEVQIEGKYNMLTNDAMLATGLSKNDYIEIIQNFVKYYYKFLIVFKEVELKYAKNLKI